MTKEALKLALEALEYFSDTATLNMDKAFSEDAMTAIKEALAQPEHIGFMESKLNPIQRLPLTDDEIDRIWVLHTFIQPIDRRQQAFARAIEAAHGIKGEA